MNKFELNHIDNLFIHASNVTGLGAIQVVSAFLGAISKMGIQSMVIACPDKLDYCHQLNVPKVSVKRLLPNSLSRLFECLVPRFYYPEAKHLIVLGDIPLRHYTNQIVLFHQPNLISPLVNKNTGMSFKFKIARVLFRYNLKFVKKMVVQTPVMQQHLEQSYPELIDRIVVIPQPAPQSEYLSVKTVRDKTHFDSQTKLTLFYPAAGYPHKNHRIFNAMEKNPDAKRLIKEICITLEQNEVQHFPQWINNLGRLSLQQCGEYYQNVDALFFPSLTESYGLPLIEAMLCGLPIVCADLPYAHCVCGEQAIYFNPEDPDSALTALNLLREKLASGWRPDWSSQLSKLPESWNDVVLQFLKLFEEADK